MTRKKDFCSYAIVMAGGQGTRFWPESVAQKPKQYLDLTGRGPLLKVTLERFEGLIESRKRFVVTVSSQKKMAEDLGRGLTHLSGPIIEPSGRNTAPCILLSMASLEKQGARQEDILVIVPSDHVILNERGFRQTIELATEKAFQRDSIVTIGISPHFPHTGYGYIHKGASLDKDIFTVEEFKEKPSLERAKKYISTGEYLWNAGMFVSSLKRLKEEFQKYAPEIFSFYGKILESLGDEEKLKCVYDQIPQNSIDYAVMEKSKHVHVIPASFDWNDLGSWDALEEVMEKKKENIFVGERGSYVEESKGNIVYAPGKYISLLGVSDLVIVSNERALVILPKERSQEVKKIVEHLKERKGLEDLL